MKPLILSLLFLLAAKAAVAAEFRHLGDYLLKAHFKVSGAELIPIPIKSMTFRVYTDGVTIRVQPEDDEEAHTSFEIYNSDGIGQQRPDSGALEVIPGVQASTDIGGMLRHLRLSKESLTITTFPNVSDQTTVSYAIAAVPKKTEPSE